MIQRHWRGHLARRRAKAARVLLQQNQAASTIQRNYRAHRRRGTGPQAGASAETALSEGLVIEMSDSERARLQAVVTRKLSAARQGRSLAEAQALHAHAREKLLQHLQTHRQADNARAVRLEQLQARLAEQARILCQPRSLAQAPPPLAPPPSRLVQIKAAELHLEAMKRHQQPWWLSLEQDNAAAADIMATFFPASKII